jgi:dolichol-phosphate mannosyltransferase
MSRRLCVGARILRRAAPRGVTTPRRALVVVPTYNERDNIERLLLQLFDTIGENAGVLVVDDSSPDGTGDAVRALARRYNRLYLIERPRKLGLGSAYITGFKWAMEAGYDAVVEMDADLSHDAGIVPRLLDTLDERDLVIGSRYVAGGAIENWGPLRRVLSFAGNLYARVLLGFGVRDSTSGFRAYRSDALAQQDLDRVRSEGYAFQIEMAHRVWLDGGRIHEVPITFSERRAGKSKLSRRIILEALWRVPVWAFEHRLRR